MKKYLLILCSFFMILACTDEDYAELNVDPRNPTVVRPVTLFNAASVSLFDQMESTNVNRNIYRLLAQYWTETTYIDEANYDFNNRSIPDNHFSIMYRNVLGNLKDAKKIVNESTLIESEKQGQIAQIEMLEVFTWAQLVDSFGDIPYSEALQGAANTTPVYDNDEDIYMDLFDRLEVAINNTDGGIGFNDLHYGGDMSLWKKFGNSLKLKLAMRIADVNSSLAQTKAVEAYNSGVLDSNADNFILNYESTTPNTNPLWEDLVQSGRTDFVAANTIVDYMNGFDDPRRPYYFAENLGAGVYEGGIYGDGNVYATTTHVGDLMHDPTFRGVLMDYSEVNFYLAEAAARGWSVGGSAEDYYNTAIQASMDDWGVDSAEADSYLAQSDVAWSTANGDWRQKIGTQMWISLYNRGFEGWSAWRKFDAPEMNTAAQSQLPVPLRMTYPIDEQTLNGTNYAAASSAIGGDTQQTPVFWDVN